MDAPYRRRWRTPADWVCTRRAMRRTQLADPGTCGACGTYLDAGLHHWHYRLRWVTGFREPPWQRGRPALDVVFSTLPDSPDCPIRGGRARRLVRSGRAVDTAAGRDGGAAPAQDGSAGMRPRRPLFPQVNRRIPMIAPAVGKTDR